MEIVKDAEQEQTWFVIEGDEKIGGLTTANGLLEVWSLRGKLVTDRQDEQTISIDL